MVVRYGANVTKINVSTEIWNCPPPDLSYFYYIFILYKSVSAAVPYREGRYEIFIPIELFPLFPRLSSPSCCRRLF